MHALARRGGVHVAQVFGKQGRDFGALQVVEVNMQCGHGSGMSGAAVLERLKVHARMGASQLSAIAAVCQYYYLLLSEEINMPRRVRHCLVLICMFTALPVVAQDERDLAAIEAYIEQAERAFAEADLESAMELFTDDAIILQENGPDIVGKEAIRAAYAGMLETFHVATDLTTESVEISGDLAVEHGTYTFRLTDKASGQIVSDTNSRYLHVFKRQAGGPWQTWRMMVNTPQALVPQ